MDRPAAGRGANPPSYDFLAILQAALAQRGLHYRVAVVSQNADIGPAPLVAPALRLRRADVTDDPAVRGDACRTAT